MAEGGSPKDHPARDPIPADIDAVDDALLDLVAARLKLAQTAAPAPPSGAPPLYPARDVAVLRRLTAKAEGVEPELVVELWRALIAANVRKQRVIDVVVGGAPKDPARLFDIARRSFGARTRLSYVSEPQAALLRAVEQPERCVAVTPWPAAPGVGSWWPALSESRFHKLRLIAALPVHGPVADTPEAAVFSTGDTEEAGGDVTLLLVDDPHHRMQRALNETKLKGVEVARSEPRALVRVDGFLAIDDPRAKIMGAMVERVRVLGSYARV